jgi:hypothetical protein
VDSPGQAFTATHLGFAGSSLTKFQFNLTFTGFLVLWTNVTGVVGPTGNVADQTYGVILEQPWNTAVTYNVDAAGNGAAAGAPAINLPAATTHSPVVAVTGTTGILVPPTGLSLLAINAQH